MTEQEILIMANLKLLFAFGQSVLLKKFKSISTRFQSILKH